MSLQSSDPDQTDGRRRRTQITRQNIVKAAIALQNDGVMRPSMQQISDRAGVSLRTAFQHFPEKRRLTRAVLGELTRINRIDPPPPELATHSAIETRIARFLDLRVRQLEALTPHRRASNAMIATSRNLQKHRLRVRARYRKVVATWFSPELDPLPPASRRRWLISIATLVDWEMWQSLRTYPSRGIAEAKECLFLLLSAALRQIEAESRGR